MDGSIQLFTVNVECLFSETSKAKLAEVGAKKLIKKKKKKKQVNKQVNKPTRQ